MTRYTPFGIILLQDLEGNLILSDKWLNLHLHIPKHLLMTETHEISKNNTLGKKLRTFLGDHLQARWNRAERMVEELDGEKKKNYAEIYKQQSPQALRILERELFLRKKSDSWTKENPQARRKSTTL